MANHRLLLLLLLLSLSFATSELIHDKFMQCMSTHLRDHNPMEASKLIHTSNSSYFSNLYQTFLQNPRLVKPITQKPLLIISPSQEPEIQAAVICSKGQNLQIRVRSGGHDYEGQSYISTNPYIIIDLINLRSVDVNLQDETAWVQTGATLGELYYNIAKKSKIHAFPAGTCPTVGVGGHISGGGLGFLQRKHGLAADNVLDAHLVDVNGRVLDRKAMGESLFWAIRGGGAGASFGIITAWKIKLVRVPETVTAFTVSRTTEEGAAKLVNKWQYIAHKLDPDLFIRIIVQNEAYGNKRVVKALFNSLFLGKTERLLDLMRRDFPELGLQGKDCNEMSWIQSVLYVANLNRWDPLEVLLNRDSSHKGLSFKAKSDFVKVAIPEYALEGAWTRLQQEDKALIIMEPFGGRLHEIAESEIAFPHRKGNLYNIQYLVKWEMNGEENKHVYWMREFYRYMAPFVSPRTAYVNYRDHDLGVNNEHYTSYEQASAWGYKYYGGNFRRLALVKSQVDPFNFFRSEQSIPSLLHISEKMPQNSATNKRLQATLIQTLFTVCVCLLVD